MEETTQTQKVKKIPGLYDPAFAAQANQKGIAADKAGNSSLAEAFYRAAHACDPANSFILGNLMNSLNQQKRFAEAETLGKANFKKHRKNEWFMGRYAEALYRQEKYAEALPVCEEREKIAQGQNVFFQTWLYGVCLLRTGQPRLAEQKFFESTKIEEAEDGYDGLIECFEKNGTFAANESFMVERLFIERKSELSQAVRRYWLAKYYLAWSEKLALEDSDAAERKLGRALEHAEQAVDFAALASGDDKDDNNAAQELEDANALLNEITSKVNGFEPPSGYKPPEPA